MLSPDLATFTSRFGIDGQSWIDFIEETLPSVAILAFASSFLLNVTVTFCGEEALHGPKLN